MPESDKNKLKTFYNKRNIDIQSQLNDLSVVFNGVEYTDGNGNLIKITDDKNSLLQNYRNVCGSLDNRILELNGQINAKKITIVNLGQAGNAVGCGSTDFGSYQINQDRIQYAQYDLNPNVETNPFNSTTYTLTSGLSGIGYTDYAETVFLSSLNVGVGSTSSIEIDGSGVGIGSYVSGIGTTGAINSTCTGYATSIETLRTEIISIRSEINNLLTAVNVLKTEKTKIEIQSYANEKSKVVLQNEATQIGIALSYLNNAYYSSYM